MKKQNEQGMVEMKKACTKKTLEKHLSFRFLLQPSMGCFGSFW
jgi:hypothetical protein